MALTIARNIALYQCLEVPFATKFYTLDGIGALASETDVSGATQGQAKTQIDAHVATLDATSGLTELQALLDRWIALGTDVSAIEAGNVGEIAGVSNDPERERDRIKQHVQIIVPFFRFHEVLEKRQRNEGTISILR